MEWTLKFSLAVLTIAAIEQGGVISGSEKILFPIVLIAFSTVIEIILFRLISFMSEESPRFS